MKSDTICPICTVVIGKYHGYEQTRIICGHIRSVHPVEYKEIKEVAISVYFVGRKYGVSPSSLSYYEK